MGRREPRTVRIDPDVWQSFTNKVEDWEGQKHGEIGRHVENALNEYINNDRYARVENKLDEALIRLDSQNEHTHTRQNMTASGTVERARDVYKRLVDNHDAVIKDDDVTRAIEDLAGADPRTVEKYKSMLKRRELLYAHPANTPVWTTERSQWLEWTETHINNDPTVDIFDVANEYDISAEQYDKLVSKTDG